MAVFGGHSLTDDIIKSKDGKHGDKSKAPDFWESRFPIGFSNLALEGMFKQLLRLAT